MPIKLVLACSQCLRKLKRCTRESFYIRQVIVVDMFTGTDGSKSTEHPGAADHYPTPASQTTEEQVDPV